MLSNILWIILRAEVQPFAAIVVVGISCSVNAVRTRVVSYVCLHCDADEKALFLQNLRELKKDETEASRQLLPAWFSESKSFSIFEVCWKFSKFESNWIFRTSFLTHLLEIHFAEQHQGKLMPLHHHATTWKYLITMNSVRNSLEQIYGAICAFKVSLKLRKTSNILELVSFPTISSENDRNRAPHPQPHLQSQI